MTTTATPKDSYMSTLGQDFYPDCADLPTIEALFESDESIEESTVFAHYFAPGYDFWLLAFDADTGIAFGKACWVNSEFGTVYLKELCTEKFNGFAVEREVDMHSAFRAFMKPKPLSQFRTEMG